MSDAAPAPPAKPAPPDFDAAALARSLAGSVFIFLNPFLLIQVLRQSVGQCVCCLRELRRAAAAEAVTMGFPIDGEGYVARGGAARATSHSWHVLSQRYALDILRVDANLSSSAPPHEALTDYYIYEAAILSPIDGVVVAAAGGLRDHPAGAIASPSLISRDLRGNHCIIEHPAGWCCVLAHFKAGSLAVRAGDRVARGQRLAVCGNSGHSSEPHLHLQAQSTRSFYAASGRPIVFDNVAVRRDAKAAFAPADKAPERGDFLKPLPDCGAVISGTPNGAPLGWTDLGNAVAALTLNLVAAAVIYDLALKAVFGVIRMMR